MNPHEVSIRKKRLKGQSLGGDRRCRHKLPRGVSVSVGTSMSVTVESANVVPDSVRDGHHAILVAGAFCTDILWSWETEIAPFLAANKHFTDLSRHANAHTSCKATD